MNLQKISNVLNLLSVVAVNPVFASAGPAIASTLKLVASLVERGAEGADQLDALTKDIEQMVKEGRQPSPRELKDLRQRSDEAHAILQGMAAPAATSAPAPAPVVSASVPAPAPAPVSLTPDSPESGTQN